MLRQDFLWFTFSVVPKGSFGVNGIYQNEEPLISLEIQGLGYHRALHELLGLNQGHYRWKDLLDGR